jgi:hypothetical protein
MIRDLPCDPAAGDPAQKIQHSLTGKAISRIDGETHVLCNCREVAAVHGGQPVHEYTVAAH